MAAWAGFSEDELRKLKKTASQGYASPTANQNKRKLSFGSHYFVLLGRSVLGSTAWDRFA